MRRIEKLQGEVLSKQATLEQVDLYYSLILLCLSLNGTLFDDYVAGRLAILMDEQAAEACKLIPLLYQCILQKKTFLFV